MSSENNPLVFAPSSRIWRRAKKFRMCWMIGFGLLWYFEFLIFVVGEENWFSISQHCHCLLICLVARSIFFGRIHTFLRGGTFVELAV